MPKVGEARKDCRGMEEIDANLSSSRAKMEDMSCGETAVGCTYVFKEKEIGERRRPLPWHVHCT